MLMYMQNQEGINSFNDFAKKLTDEYDSVVKMGFQTINNVPIQRGNKTSMETFVNLACQKALTVREGNHTFIDDVGNAIKFYWTGAMLMTPNPPVTPAQFAISNLSSTKAVVSNPGQWSPIGPTSPIDDSNLFLDMLVAGIQSHLPTIEFLYETISSYPSIPAPIIAPGILQAKGYTIPQ